jgi:hypothetical protein
VTNREIARGWSLTVAVAALSFALLLTGCLHDDSAAAQRVSAHGLSITLPESWDGRIYKHGPEYGTVLQAGNFELPAEDNDIGEKTVKSLVESHSDRIYINILDHGPPQPEWPGWVQGTLPLSVSRSDFGIFGGVGPCAVCKRQLALRHVIVNGHALIVLVSFGTRRPSDAAMAEANDVLQSVSVTPLPS